MEESHPHRALIEVSTPRLRNMLKTGPWGRYHLGGTQLGWRNGEQQVGRPWKITSPIHAGGPGGARGQGSV